MESTVPLATRLWRPPRSWLKPSLASNGRCSSNRWSLCRRAPKCRGRKESMEKFTIYTGTTVPLMNDNIDTDQILLAFAKLIDKKRLWGNTHTCLALFGWPIYWGSVCLLSQNTARQPFWSLVTILGLGLSEHAAWALLRYGFKRVVIAGSFGDIHYNNELNNGMLPIVQPLEEFVKKLAGFSRRISDGGFGRTEDPLTCWRVSLWRSVKIGSTNCSIDWMISGLRFSTKTWFQLMRRTGQLAA